MREMVANGEADALVSERVWQELARGLMEKEPSRMLEVLQACGAPLEVRFATLARSLDPFAVEALADRLKLPSGVRELALLTARHANAILDAQELDAEALLELLNAADAWRRPDRFRDLLSAATAGERGTGRAVTRLQRAREAAVSIDVGAVAHAGPKQSIRDRVNAARLAAIRAALN
jgi:tRNA nucleotidyltransferase (CCA-adding enzyme)